MRARRWAALPVSTSIDRANLVVSSCACCADNGGHVDFKRIIDEMVRATTMSAHSSNQNQSPQNTFLNSTDDASCRAWYDKNFDVNLLLNYFAVQNWAGIWCCDFIVFRTNIF